MLQLTVANFVVCPKQRRTKQLMSKFPVAVTSLKWQGSCIDIEPHRNTTKVSTQRTVYVCINIYPSSLSWYVGAVVLERSDKIKTFWLESANMYWCCRVQCCLRTTACWSRTWFVFNLRNSALYFLPSSPTECNVERRLNWWQNWIPCGEFHNGEGNVYLCQFAEF